MEPLTRELTHLRRLIARRTGVIDVEPEVGETAAHYYQRVHTRLAELNHQRALQAIDQCGSAADPVLPETAAASGVAPNTTDTTVSSVPSRTRPSPERMPQPTATRGWVVGPLAAVGGALLLVSILLLLLYTNHIPTRGPERVIDLPRGEEDVAASVLDNQLARARAELATVTGLLTAGTTEADASLLRQRHDSLVLRIQEIADRLSGEDDVTTGVVP
jgi:hypothetical protein